MTDQVHPDDAGFLVIVKHVITWRKPILGITLLAIVAAVVFTMPKFYPPEYESVGVFYPTASTSISKALLATDLSGRQDALKFGEEEEAEQLLQILESEIIFEKMLKKYNLMERYRIDEDESYRFTKLTKKFYSRVKFRRNEHMAIEVSVHDEDREIASKMCADIMELMDSVKTEIVKQRANEALEIVADQYKHKEKEIKLLEDSLTALGKLGIINYEEQAASVSDALDKAKADYYASVGNYGKDHKKTLAMAERLADVQNDYDRLGRFGGNWLSIKEGLVLELEQFKLLKEKYEQARVDVERKLTYKFVTNYPHPAEKKSKPIRSLIVAVSAISTFVLSALLFILYEVFNKNKKWLFQSK